MERGQNRDTIEEIVCAQWSGLGQCPIHQLLCYLGDAHMSRVGLFSGGDHRVSKHLARQVWSLRTWVVWKLAFAQRKKAAQIHAEVLWQKHAALFTCFTSEFYGSVLKSLVNLHLYSVQDEPSSHEPRACLDINVPFPHIFTWHFCVLNYKVLSSVAVSSKEQKHSFFRAMFD